MACFPESGGCEHGRLVPFIAHLSEAENTQWKHSVCLDIEDRNEPQPEVLYENTSGLRLVVEKKSVMWPLDYAKGHAADHYLADKVQEKLGPILGTKPAMLTVPSGACLNRKDIDQFATELSYSVKHHFEALEGEKELNRRDGRIPFVFRFQHPRERDYDDPPEGLGISFTIKRTYALFDSSNIPTSLIEHIQKHVRSAVKKFATYSEDRRILLLQTFAEIQWRDDDWWSAAIQAAGVIEAMEIWVQDEDDLGEGPVYQFRKVYAC